MKADQDLFSKLSDTRHHVRRLAWFVTGALLIVIAAAGFMSVQKGLFKRTAQLHCLVDSAKGMVPGMAVKLNGFRIGSLGNLVMDTDGRVSMVLAVSDEYIHLIHRDAIVRLVKEDLIGESIIEVLPGLAGSPTVENNALIAFERARDAGEELSKLASQLQPILADVKNITAYVDNADGDLKKTLRELKRASTALADTGEGVSDLTRRNRKQIQAAINSASNTLVNLDAALPPLLKQVDASLHHVEGATAAAKEITSDVKTITSRLAVELPPALSEGRAAVGEGRAVLSEGLETLENTHEVVNAVKGSWPINSLLPQQEDHPLPLDSHAPYKH